MVDIRKKQHAPLPGKVRNAVNAIIKERGFQGDPSSERVGYGRKPNLPVKVVVESDERKWLEAKILKLYNEDPSITSIKPLVSKFQRMYKGD